MSSRSGCCSSRPALVLYARLPVDGHYFWDLFPAFLLSGIGMAFAFIPMTIGALAGVRHSDAGVASGLINTTQQIGGAIGVAAATTIAATYTSHYLLAHPGATPTCGRRADPRLLGRLLRARRGRRCSPPCLVAVVVESKPALAAQTVAGDEIPLEAAA